MPFRNTPTELKILAGNPGKRPLNKNEPKPAVSIPDPPETLKPKAREKYYEIAPLLMKMGVFTNVDGLGLCMMVEAYVDYLDARAALDEAGGWYYQVITKEGAVMWRLHPAAGVVQDCDRRIRAWLIEYGKTPAARARLKVESGHQEQDPAERYFGATAH